MKKYKVVTTDPALNDMEGVYNHIAFKLKSPENAIKQYRRITDAILSLDEMPYRAGIIDSDTGLEFGFRRLLVDGYMIIYYIEEDTVFVTDVLYGSSDIDGKLREPK